MLMKLNKMIFVYQIKQKNNFKALSKTYYFEYFFSKFLTLNKKNLKLVYLIKYIKSIHNIIEYISCLR